MRKIYDANLGVREIEFSLFEGHAKEQCLNLSILKDLKVEKREKKEESSSKSLREKVIFPSEDFERSLTYSFSSLISYSFSS